VTPSSYGFTKEQDATNPKEMRWWVVLGRWKTTRTKVKGKSLV
jgi:hypothetical protein